MAAKGKTALPVISCTDRPCGVCCLGQSALPVRLAGGYFRLEPVAPLPEALKAELRAAVEEFQRTGWPADGAPCIWFDAEARRCKHYEHRPQLCRDAVKPGDDACRADRIACGIDPRPPRAVYFLRNGRLVKEVR